MMRLSNQSDNIQSLEDDEVSLLEESIKPRKNLPPLLSKLSQRKPEKLDYVGVSYGLTQPLLKFWSKAGFTPVYISQVANNLTGEHTTIMIKPLKHDEENDEDSAWLKAFYSDFRKRLISLLGYDGFRAFPSSTYYLFLLVSKCKNCKVFDLFFSSRVAFTYQQGTKTTKTRSNFRRIWPYDIPL